MRESLAGAPASHAPAHSTLPTPVRTTPPSISSPAFFAAAFHIAAPSCLASCAPLRPPSLLRPVFPLAIFCTLVIHTD